MFFAIKVIHVLSATVLLGTGIGTAFQMWAAHRTGDVRTIAGVAKNVIAADFLFTTPAVIVQPVTGIILVHLTGIDLWSSWLLATYGLYVLAGACWLPVVWLQIRIGHLAQAAARSGGPLPSAYFRLMRIWFVLGWPAFLSVIAVVWLMVAKPVLW